MPLFNGKGAESEVQFEGMSDCKEGKSHSRWQKLEGDRLSCGIKPKTELTDLGPGQELGQIVLTMPTIKALVLQSTREGDMDPRYLPRALPIHLFLQH
jgi:hypothetical protein